MSKENHNGLEKLVDSFPRLPETEQGYILGMAEGLKYMQGKLAPTAPHTGSQQQTGGRDAQWEN